MPRPKTWKLHTRKYGRSVVLKVNTRLDISGFTDCAVFPYLVMAANPHLSAPEIQDVLAGLDDCQWRSETWIKTRHWMFEVGEPLAPSADGLDDRARQLIRSNPRQSARKLVMLLQSNGINRPLDWVYRSRND